MSDPVPTLTDRASVSDLLEAAVRLWRVTLPKCLPLAMIALLCAKSASIYWVATGHPDPVWKIPEDDTYLTLLVLGNLIYLVLISALIVRQRAVAAGGGAHLSGEIGQALRRLPALLGALVLTVCAVLLGLVLAIVPGVFLLFCFAILVPVVMFELGGPIAAMLRCVRLVRPIWWKTCAAIVIGWLVVIICLIVLAAILAMGSLLAGSGSGAFQAVATAIQLGVFALVAVFSNALLIVLYSAASSSA